MFYPYFEQPSLLISEGYEFSISDTAMKLFRTKHYREVPCKACDGKGYLRPGTEELERSLSEDMKKMGFIKLATNLLARKCLECSGKGTVLERVGD